MAAATEPQVRYRWTDGDADWALLDNGHLKVLRCGDLVPEVRVRFTIPEISHRKGTVRALVPGYGPGVPVAVVVELDPPKCRQQPNVPLKPILYHYRPDQVEVLHERVRWIRP